MNLLLGNHTQRWRICAHYWKRETIWYGSVSNFWYLQLSKRLCYSAITLKQKMRHRRGTACRVRWCSRGQYKRMRGSRRHPCSSVLHGLIQSAVSPWSECSHDEPINSAFSSFCAVDHYSFGKQLSLSFTRALYNVSFIAFHMIRVTDRQNDVRTFCFISTYEL